MKSGIIVMVKNSYIKSNIRLLPLRGLAITVFHTNIVSSRAEPIETMVTLVFNRSCNNDK